MYFIIQEVSTVSYSVNDVKELIVVNHIIFNDLTYFICRISCCMQMPYN
jgi:hypothetical protein